MQRGTKLRLLTARNGRPPARPRARGGPRPPPAPFPLARHPSVIGVYDSGAWRGCGAAAIRIRFHSCVVCSIANFLGRLAVRSDDAGGGPARRRGAPGSDSPSLRLGPAAGPRGRLSGPRGNDDGRVRRARPMARRLGLRAAPPPAPGPISGPTSRLSGRHPWAGAGEGGDERAGAALAMAAPAEGDQRTFDFRRRADSSQHASGTAARVQLRCLLRGLV